MTDLSENVVTEPQISLSELQDLQFEWLARAARLWGTALLVVDTKLQIKFYDRAIADILELDSSVDLTGANLLDIAGELAIRGDFGPGDPAIFVDLVRNEFTKSAGALEPSNRKLNFVTPSGKRVQFRQEIKHDGLFMLGCRDVTKSYIQKHALKVALDSSDSGYIMFDVETRKFHDVGNFASRKHCNRLAQRLLNDELKNVIHPEDYKKVKSVRKQAEANKEPWSGTFRILDDQADTIWVKVQATPQISESGVITSYIFFYLSLIHI